MPLAFIFFNSLLLWSLLTSLPFLRLHLQPYRQASLLFLVQFNSSDPVATAFIFHCSPNCPFLPPLPLLSPLPGCSSACIVLPLAPASSAIRGPGERTLAQISILWTGGGCNRRCSHVSLTALRANGALIV